MSPHTEVLRLFANPFPRPRLAETEETQPPDSAAPAPVTTGAGPAADTTRSTR